MIGRAKEKVAQFRQLGEAAGAVDVEQLFERGLGMLLDDVLGPAKEQVPAPPSPRIAEGPTVRVVTAPAGQSAPSSSPRPSVVPGVCIALDHEHMPPHRARLPGCVAGPG